MARRSLLVKSLADLPKTVRNLNANVELVDLKRIGPAVEPVARKRDIAAVESKPVVDKTTLELLARLKDAGLPPPVPEFRFCQDRRWRLDFAWPSPYHRVALEIDGGVWTQGRHTRGQGFIEDQRKFNRATLLGWRVIHTTPDRLDEAVRDLGFLLCGDAA